MKNTAQNSEHEGRRRVIALAVLMGAAMIFFGSVLMKMQIVDYNKYQQLAEQGSVKKQVVEAARGEIVDRYGRPMAENRIGFDVVFDKAFMPKSRENAIILSLVELFQVNGQAWNDSLPLSMTVPCAFLPDKGKEIEAMIKKLGLNPQATAEDVFYQLKKQYELEEKGYTDQQVRYIMGVRYDMTVQEYSITTPYTFASDISVETLTKIKELSYDMPGVDIIENPIREYTSKDIAPHVIGYIGPIFKEEYETLSKKYDKTSGKHYQLNDVVGKDGIEKYFEDTLRGTNGQRQVSLNAQGIVQDVNETVSPIAGNTVVLTLDTKLQKTGQDSLRDEILLLNRTAKEGQGKEAFAGAVVALDIKTGEILVSATYPSYDLSTFKQDYSALSADKTGAPLMNRAFNATYTAGSIYKPSVAVAGLNEGLIDRNSNVLCGLVYTFYDDYQPRCLSSHGNINVLRALQKSCNIFFYDTGRRLGIDTINSYSSRLGLAQKTGIEIPVAQGTLSSPEAAKAAGQNWYPGDVLQSAIGQAYNEFTPLELANYCATIARKGTRLETHLIRSIKSYNFDQTVLETQPKVISTMEDVPTEVFDTVIEGMEMASNMQGTSWMVFGDYPIRVASKTGTPETSLHPNSTFIAFAPVEDPQIAICVVIEKGWHGYTGAPVAKAILDEYFATEASVTGKTPGILLP